MYLLKALNLVSVKTSILYLCKAISNIFKQKFQLSIIILLTFCYTGLTQNVDITQHEASNKKITSYIQEISDQLDQDKISYDSFNVWLRTLYLYRDSIINETFALKAALDHANESLSKLGAPPAAGQPREPENVAKLRRELNAQINRLSGLSKSANLLDSNLNKLIDRVTTVKATHFLSGMTSRSVSPFSKELWTSAATEFMVASKLLAGHVSSFFKQKFGKTNGHSDLLLLIVTLLVVVTILMFPRSSIWKKIELASVKSNIPHDLQSSLRIVTKPFIFGILALIAGGILFWSAKEIGVITSIGKGFAMRIWFGSAIFVFIWHYAQNLFIPGRPIWNTVICKPGRERYCRNLFVGVFALFVFDRILTTGFELASVGIKLVMAQAIITSVLFALMIWLLFKTKNWQFEDEIIDNETTSDLKSDAPEVVSHFDPDQDKHKLFVDVVKLFCQFVAAIVFVAIILEYIRFSNFVFHRFVLMMFFLISMFSFRALALWGLAQIPFSRIRKTKVGSSAAKGNIKKPLKQKEQSEDKQEPINFWLKTAVDLNLVVFGVPVFMLVLGFDWVNVEQWIHLLTSGFTIGAITISFQNIANGVAIFLFIIIITRTITGSANKKLERYTNMDSGIRNSTFTLINYFGVILAIIAALPVLGIKLSQITMIISALSVGIGFGLRNIVNDFVSGIILLIERPIKLGDWIVVDSGQGYVKSIRLRVTEIETFDKAALIIPNSELVSSSIQNWFYNNKQGRVKIAVGVDYNSDPKKVEEILLQCANQHPSVLYSPAAFVSWDDFGNNSLNFKVYAYLKNYDNCLTVKTELRNQIFEKLNEAGIAIPFPQLDLHVKNNEMSKSIAASSDGKSEKKDDKEDQTKE